MDHTHIVRAGDLDRYSDTRDSQSVTPELIYWLVKQSVPNLTVCRIPYGDAVNQPGWDGLVECDESFLEFIPKGKSYWEIGTSAAPQEKATSDFKKRTEELSDADRAQASYIFVTPRSSGSGGWNEPEQTKWLERRKNTGWKLIRIIDGVKLADWLREFPVVGKWMAKKLNLTGSLGGIETPAEHWENVLAHTPADDPKLPAKLFTEGRTNVCEALKAVFEGKTKSLMLFAESPQDVPDFVSAFLETLDPMISRLYGNRCLYIHDEEAWRSVVEAHSAHVLVSDPRLGLETEERADLTAIASRKGHSIIVPLCGAWSGDNPQILKLRSPSQLQIETILKEAGYSDARARELARIGGERLSALRRHLRGLGTLPPYATWDNAALIAQAGLAGQWDGGNSADRSALEKLLGKGYGEWIEILRPDTLRSDSPLIQYDEKWRFVARGEAWNVLGGRVFDDDLDRFQETAVAVLGEHDPKFDLPKEERFAASLRDKNLTHSSSLRKGLAETLALVGSRSKALTSCSQGKAETTAVLVVRRLLEGAKWDRWAALDSYLPLLAEAAPDEFLDAVESALIRLEASPFHEIFAQEGGAGIGGWNYMSGLLWALESLAWNADYLSRVSVILADIASIDPGGNWANRPANSLADIFLPWHVQTTAQFDKRKSSIRAVLREQPKVGWQLLLALLPHSHGFTTGSYKPIWREYIPRDWKDSVTRSEYWEQIVAFTELAIELAQKGSQKLAELVARLSDLPQAAQDKLLEHLVSDKVTSLPEAERLPLWEKLTDLVRQHRRFADADWALPENVLKKIDAAAIALAPEAPQFKYHYLFSGNDFDLFDENGDYEEQQRRLNEARENAIKAIADGGKINSVLEFARNVSAPYDVGRALGALVTDELEDEILPSYLNSKDEIIRRVVAGFVWGRFWKRRWIWVDSVLEKAWNAQQKAAFLILLPFEDETWRRVKSHLSDVNEALYWREVNVNPYGPERELTTAIEKLLQHGRPAAAVLCAARISDGKEALDHSLATRALLGVLETPTEVAHLDNHRTVKLITHLQKLPETDQEALFRIEWNFLPWLGRFSHGTPRTLEKRLASDPAFFAEVIGLVFRSKNKQVEETEVGEDKQNLARTAYKLLTEWRICPGTLAGDSFDESAFDRWINEARKITEESGHAEVAQIQIGHVLTQAPCDPNGLWIHEAVAATLNYRDTGDMRSGFTTELFNQRGVHGFSAGRDERKLAKLNREKAEALDAKGFTRFATAMREFAEQYERQAEREERRSPLDD